MAGGYFNDGALDLELGEHAFATPSAARRNVVLTPGNRTAAVLDSGGGMLNVEVTAQRLRANLGDAERYIYELFADLAASGPGDLGVEDNRGSRHVFGDSICIGAMGEVKAFRFADMRLTFLSPEKSSEPAWGSIPTSPPPYAGGSTA